MANESRNYCGAKTRAGTPCKKPAGFRTSHLGSGRCNLHGGCSTGAKTPEGKANQARKHGLYAKILSAKDLERLHQVQDFDPGAVLTNNFYLVQAKALGLIENETKFSKDARTLLQACAVLVEREELSQDFVDSQLRPLLEEMSTQKLSRIFNSSANLATAANALDKAGAIARQLSISKNFIVNILKNCDNHETRNMALECIRELKLDGGLPIEELDVLLVKSEETTAENGEEKS